MSGENGYYCPYCHKKYYITKARERTLMLTGRVQIQCTLCKRVFTVTSDQLEDRLLTRDRWKKGY